MSNCASSHLWVYCVCVGKVFSLFVLHVTYALLTHWNKYNWASDIFVVIACFLSAFVFLKTFVEWNVTGQEECWMTSSLNYTAVTDIPSSLGSLSNGVDVHCSPQICQVLWSNSVNIPSCHHVKQPSIIALDLPLPFLLLIFLFITMFSNVFLIIICPKNDVCLFRLSHISVHYLQVLPNLFIKILRFTTIQ